MSPSLQKQRAEVSSNIAFPFITIALQTDASIGKEKLEQKIKLIADRIGNELRSIEGMPGYIVEPAVNKVKSIFNNLEISLNKKSTIVFLAPFIEKVYSLNFLIEEKVVVGEPLNLRELVVTKKAETKYLLLSLHTDKCYMYLGDGEKLSLIVFNSVDQLKSRLNRGKEQFLSHVDNVLTHILKSYGLPLIAVGTAQMLSLFTGVSKNNIEITSALYYDSDEEDVTTLQQLTKPLVQDWEKLKESYLLRKLHQAVVLKRAETGIHKVCKAAKEKRGKLLIVEKDFYYSFRFGNSNEVFTSKAVSVNGSLGDDAVEDVIERVLAAGGNIEFVNPGVLSEYMHIALVL